VPGRNVGPQRLLAKACGWFQTQPNPDAMWRKSCGLTDAILGQRDMAEALSEAIDDRHHGIAVGDRKRGRRRQKSFARRLQASKFIGRWAG